MTLTVVFENNPGGPHFTTGWGFACVVELPETTVLFDTGADGRMLIDNMRAAGLEPDAIDLVVLSHIHGDHTGGLGEIMALNRGVPVFVPPCFSDGFIRAVEQAGGEARRVEPCQRLAGPVLTTGEVSGPLNEQALVLQTAEGLVVVTGCAHPGVDAMVAAAEERCGGEVSLVFGGFHLGGCSRGRIEEMARRLQAMGVERAGPCHCSGDLSREVFADLFGGGYVDVHVGTRMVLPSPDGG